MFRNISKSLAAVAAIFVTAAVVGAAALFTDTVTGVVNPPPGGRRCIDLPTRALTNASINDFVMSGHKVKFVFLGKPDGAADFTEISNSGPDPVASYAKAFNAQTNPSFFPGVFRTCARNPSDKPSTDSLTITVDK
jgi:hypothetical protein